MVVATVLEVGGFDSLEATEAGLREGVFFEHHIGGDVPLFEDVRHASVVNLAAQYHVDAAHTRHVAELALGLFDELAAVGLHPGDPIERELLWSASVLHDIGMSVDYDDHHKHSRYLILNAGLPGYAPSEVALIAQAARYHRKGTPDAGWLAPVLEPGRRGPPAPPRRAPAPGRGPRALARPGRDATRTSACAATASSCASSPPATPPSPAGPPQRETAVFERAFGARLTVTGAP